MKALLSFFAALTLLLMVGTASAQIAPYVDASIGGSSTFTGNAGVTQRNPNYIVGAGVEFNSKLLLLDVNAAFNSANYRSFGLANGDSYAATVQGTGYVKVGHLLLGGGTYYKDQVVDGNIKSVFQNISGNTFVPLVGGGVQFSRDRFTALYELPGRSATNQRTVDFHNELYLTKKGHLRLTQDVSVNSSVAQITTPGLSLSQRVSGGQAAAGLKLVF
jgi:hypothetical protein